MKKIGKIIGALAILVEIIMNSPMAAYAEGSVTIESEKTSCQVGDSFSITVSALAGEDSAVPPQIRVEFDTNRLQFDNCSVQYGGGNGGLIDINDNAATIDFTTLSGGDARISVGAILNEDSTDIQTAEFTMSVEGEDTAAAMESGTAEEATGVSEASISTGDGRLVQAVFASEFMPVMFHKTTTQYQGQQVECAQFDMGDLTLLYTTDEIGSDGLFCVYNTSTGELSPLKVIMGIENRFIVILNDCDGDIPAGYAKTVVNWDGTTLAAYVPQDNTLSAFGGLNTSDFFLVYAISSEGIKGWYQYDKMEGTFQRFLQMTGANGTVGGDNAGMAGKSGSADGNFLDEYISADIQAILLLVFLGLTLILFIVVIVLAVKNSRYGYYEEEYYEEEDYEQEYRPRKGVTASSIVEETMNDDEEDEEEYDSDDSVADDEEVDDGEATDDEVEDDNDDDEIEDDDIEVLEDERVEKKSKKASSRRRLEEIEDEDEDDDEEDEEDEDDYFDPRWTRRERKEMEKQRRKAEKEAAKDEKWRLKEERKAQKMRARGYEEASPMDWSTFGENMSDKKDDRRPKGKSNLPSYMTDSLPKDEIEEAQLEDDEQATEVIDKQTLPPRKMTPAMSEQREAESAKKFKEDELRKKQKRLFEQQQRIEEQRRIEEEQYELKQRQEQQKFILDQQVEEDLDEDFQFEFLEL